MGKRFRTKWHISLFILLSFLFEAKADCYTNFNITPALLTPDEPIGNDDGTSVIIHCKIPEKTNLDRLYTVSWTKDLDIPPYTDVDDENTASDYMNFGANTERVNVDLSSSIAGLIDYGGESRIIELDITYYFDFDDGQCSLLLNHDIEDENTQKPKFQYPSYELSIREDYPVSYPIPNFMPKSVDFDVDPPNIDFIISTDENCPLEVVPPTQFETPDGEWVYVEFQLNHKLDYESLQEPYHIQCTATLTDLGTPVFQDSSNITITVVGWSDEVPLMNSIMYEGYIDELTEGTRVHIDPVIEASDADRPSEILKFSISDIDSEVPGTDYFFINETTGEIYITQDIDDVDFLANEKAHFYVEAFDGIYTSQRSVLTIVLVSDGSSLVFDKLTYSVERISPPVNELLLTVHATGADDISYSFDSLVSSGVGNFSIDSESGEITTKENDTTHGDFWLDVKAESGVMTANTQVNILITIAEEYIPYVTNSLFEGSIDEEEDPGPTQVIVTAQGAKYFCILAFEPKEYQGKFEIASNGSISTTEALDADNTTLGYDVKLKVGAYINVQTCEEGSIDDDLLRNEAMVNIMIMDKNDNEPVFVDENHNSIENMFVAFPTTKSLQRAEGSVVKVHAMDADVSSEISYSIQNNGEEVHFKIDSNSGILYFTADELQCETDCVLSLVASDTLSEDALTITIIPLEMNMIYTMTFHAIDLEDVDDALLLISMEIGVDIQQVYSAVLDSSTIYKSDMWDVEVQVYAIKEGVLLDLDEFNRCLTDSDYETAVSFTELDDFSQEIIVTDPTDVTGYQIAVGILGTIVCIIVLVLVVFACSKHYKKKEAKPLLSKKTNRFGEINEGLSKKETETSFASIFIDEYSTVGSKHNDLRKQSAISNIFSASNESRKNSVNEIKESPKVSQRKDSPVPELKTAHYPKLKKDSVELTHAIAEIHSENVESVNEEVVIPSLLLTKDNSTNRQVGGSVSSNRSSNTSHQPKSSYSDSRKGSILKDELNLTDFDEPKSVAFKILVDTSEFDVDSPSKEDDWEKLRL